MEEAGDANAIITPETDVENRKSRRKRKPVDFAARHLEHQFDEAIKKKKAKTSASQRNSISSARTPSEHLQIMDNFKRIVVDNPLLLFQEAVFTLNSVIKEKWKSNKYFPKEKTLLDTFNSIKKGSPSQSHFSFLDDDLEVFSEALKVVIGKNRKITAVGAYKAVLCCPETFEQVGARVVKYNEDNLRFMLVDLFREVKTKLKSTKITKTMMSDFIGRVVVENPSVDPILMVKATKAQFNLAQISESEITFIRKSLKTWTNKVNTALRNRVDPKSVLKSRGTRKQSMTGSIKSETNIKKEAIKEEPVVDNKPVSSLSGAMASEEESYNTLSIVDLRCMFVDDQWILPPVLRAPR